MNPAFNVGDRVRTSPRSHPMHSRGKVGVVEEVGSADEIYPYGVRLESDGLLTRYAADELIDDFAPASPQTGADAQGLRRRAAALRSDADALDRAADILEQTK